MASIHITKNPQDAISERQVLSRAHMSEQSLQKCCSCQHASPILKFYLAYRLLGYVRGVFRVKIHSVALGTEALSQTNRNPCLQEA